MKGCFVGAIGGPIILAILVAVYRIGAMIWGAVYEWFMLLDISDAARGAIYAVIVSAIVGSFVGNFLIE